VLDLWISPKQAFSTAKKEPLSPICFQPVSPKSTVPSFASITRSVHHVGRWDKVPPDDQSKILEHCHAGQGKKVWLDADTFTKHKIAIPDKFAYLLGDSEGPKSA
jgi:hypothetical protein